MLLTTNANALLQPFSTSMPAILTSDEERIWLTAPSNHTIRLIHRLHAPPAADFVIYPVSRRINQVVFHRKSD